MMSSGAGRLLADSARAIARLSAPMSTTSMSCTLLLHIHRKPAQREGAKVRSRARLLHFLVTQLQKLAVDEHLT